jgi:hypothetical protein
VQPGHSRFPCDAVEHSKNDNDANPVSGQSAHSPIPPSYFPPALLDYGFIFKLRHRPGRSPLLNSILDDEFYERPGGAIASTPNPCRRRRPMMLLPRGTEPGDAAVMPDRPFPAVDALIRRVQRVAASRPDPMHILAQTIAMTGEIGADPYAVLGVLVEGAVLTILRNIPEAKREETALTLVRLLEERLRARGVSGGDGPGS